VPLLFVPLCWLPPSYVYFPCRILNPPTPGLFFLFPCCTTTVRVPPTKFLLSLPVAVLCFSRRLFPYNNHTSTYLAQHPPLTQSLLYFWLFCLFLSGWFPPPSDHPHFLRGKRLTCQVFDCGRLSSDLVFLTRASLWSPSIVVLGFQLRGRTLLAYSLRASPISLFPGVFCGFCWEFFTPRAPILPSR